LLCFVEPYEPVQTERGHTNHDKGPQAHTSTSYIIDRISRHETWLFKRPGSSAPYSLMSHPILPPPVHSSLSRNPAQSYIRLAEKGLRITSRYLRFFHYDLLRRRRTLISVPLTSNTEKCVRLYEVNQKLNNVQRAAPLAATLNLKSSLWWCLC
jgi:hypothetical protein